VQPKRTAILVYLAVAAPRGFHRRDSLLALFWPEHDVSHARNALRQALHGLRHALGDDALIARGDEELSLEATQCRCDVWAFEEALDAGHLERAVGLYGGPFLEGFFLSGTPEFERWAEAERDRLSRRYAGALEQLAQDVETRGDLVAAVQWWSRLAEHSPYPSRVAVRLMRALDLAGDRAGAIRYANQHAARLRAQLDAEPDPEVETLAAQLRSQPPRHELADTVPALPEPSAVRARAAARPAGPRAFARSLGLIASLLLLGLAGWWAAQADRAGAHRPRRLAVLPLANQTGDSAQGYLVEGVHEAVITELAQIRSLSVISRASVMSYGGSGKSAPAIARQLNAEVLVEGAVFRAGDSIRVSLQLIEARRDRHLWAGTFEGSMRDMLSLSREASQAIARGARVTLTPGDVARLAGGRPVNRDAHIAYLRGRWHFNQNTRDGQLRSVALYQQAIALDSTYAPAFAGLADAYLILGHYTDGSADAFPKAQAIARRALELDRGLADAHMVLGHIAFEYDWDWPEAERLLRRAIELNPSDARAHSIYGAGFLIAMSRFEEAERETRLASELDPLSPSVAAAAAYPALYAGRYTEAEALLQAARRAFPDDADALELLGYTHALEGRYPEAIAELQRAGAPLGLRAWVYGRAGRQDSARALLRHLGNQARHGSVSPRQFVLAYLGLGDPERALDYLEAGFRGRTREMAWINVLPFLAPLRGHPRFQGLLARMKFPR